MSGSIKSQSSPPARPKQPLHGVIIFVSQQLVSNRAVLHQLCTALGGKFVWVFDVPFTHYICQGKLIKRGKEYKKVEEYRAKCVHPAWLKACHTYGQRVAEKLYASTYDPNRSLSFISAGDDDDDDDVDDEDDENHIPSLTSITSSSAIEKPPNAKTLIIPSSLKKKQALVSSVLPQTIPSPAKVTSQLSNEAETMLNDLESSLAQFLNNNNHQNNIQVSSRSTMNDDESSRRSLTKIRSITNMNTNQSHDTNEPSMRVEWLDDAMQAERKKMIDEDECHPSSQSQSRHGQKRALVDSNSDHSFKSKRSRI